MNLLKNLFVDEHEGACCLHAYMLVHSFRKVQFAASRYWFLCAHVRVQAQEYASVCRLLLPQKQAIGVSCGSQSPGLCRLGVAMIQLHLAKNIRLVQVVASVCLVGARAAELSWVPYTRSC